MLCIAVYSYISPYVVTYFLKALFLEPGEWSTHHQESAEILTSVASTMAKYYPPVCNAPRRSDAFLFELSTFFSLLLDHNFSVMLSIL